jgi:hypothetical protein
MATTTLHPRPCPQCGSDTFARPSGEPISLAGWYGNVCYAWQTDGDSTFPLAVQVRCGHCAYQEATVPPVPPRVLDRVKIALATLQSWNDALAQARAMEAGAHQPGRYEYDLRYGRAGEEQRTRLRAALSTLATFEDLAKTNGVEAEQVYDLLGGKPPLPEEGPEVQGWHPSHP